MAKLEDNVVPIIVLDDDDEMPENSMAGSATKLAEVNVGLDMKRVEYESFVVPTVGKAIDAENVIPHSGAIGFDIMKDGGGESFIVPTIGKVVDAENIVAKDGVTVEVNGRAFSNACVASEQNMKDNKQSCMVYGKSEKQGFIVGDFVWCKVKNDPWLPAQVYDSNDASEFALKYRPEGTILVAFFGNGSCSWCLPSQLLPFMENFVEMSRVCNSRSFLKAVQKAIDEFGRIVESDMRCKCIPEIQTGGVARPMADNGGVKAGVLVPKVNVNRLSVPKYESREVLARVRDFAKTVSVGNKLHLAILKSRLSAFYRSKGGYQLPLYVEPVVIEGLEDKIQELGPVANGFRSFSINERLKMKTVAELMGAVVKAEPKSKGSFLAGKKSRKRKAMFPDVRNGDVCEEVMEIELIPRKPEKNEVIAGEDSTFEPKESDIVFTPRETKRSKYLSPPFKILTKCVNKAYEENLPDQELNAKKHCPSFDVGISVNELLVKIQLAAVTPPYFTNDGSFDKVLAFSSAVRSSTYIHGSNYKIYHKCIDGPKQKKKLLPSQLKLSPTFRTTPVNMESGETDDFLSGVKFVSRDFQNLAAILEKYQTEFSVEEKASLNENIKQIKGKVENLCEKLIRKFVP